MGKTELVRVYGGRYKASLTQHRPKGILRFTQHGIEYVRRRRRDAIGLPVFERAP